MALNLDAAVRISANVQGANQIQAFGRELKGLESAAKVSTADLGRMNIAINRMAREAGNTTIGLRQHVAALQSLRDQKIRLKPFRGDLADNEFVVRSEIIGSRGDPIGLDYRLFRRGENWRIYDINIAGVWLVETYRNQFASEINARGIDGLITTLADRNRALEAGKL